MKGSLVIIAFFAAGIACGVTGVVPRSWAESGTDFYALCALMFCVGVSVGGDGEILTKVRSLDRRLMLLPLLTIAGTLGGSALAALLLDGRRTADCMAIGSGMGYYSLSSIFITQYRGVELGTIALMSNIIREVATLLFAPLMARWFGPLAPVTAGGATTMDTTLPIITRVSGERYVVLSLFHGALTDFSVPFLVTFFCSL